MKLTCTNGDYHVHWSVNAEEYFRARDWCFSQFGDGWGHCNVMYFDRADQANLVFVFKKLHHAQWFMLKYQSL